jgi:uncharacterized protein with PQ loop repeat
MFEGMRKVKLLNDPKFVSMTPIATIFLLESANIGQIFHMWTERTAAGQSLSSWICVNVALWLWGNFYRVCCPEQKWAIRANWVGVILNALVIATVIWFRYGVEK